MDLAGVPPDTANAFTKVAKPPTATKSRAGSKPGFLTTSGSMEIVWSCVKNRVVPSGAAALSVWAAICPPAPALFSTTTGLPNVSLSLSANTRAMASVPPPAGKPTISLTVPFWAHAMPLLNIQSALTASVIAMRRVGFESGRREDARTMVNSDDGADRCRG